MIGQFEIFIYFVYLIEEDLYSFNNCIGCFELRYISKWCKIMWNDYFLKIYNFMEC